MNAANAIAGEVQAVSGPQVLPLLRERARQSRQVAHLHTDRQVLAFHNAVGITGTTDKMIAAGNLSHNGEMVTLDTLRVERREEILRLAGRRGAHSLRVFGSVARGEANENSDLDLLVAPRRAG